MSKTYTSRPAALAAALMALAWLPMALAQTSATSQTAVTAFVGVTVVPMDRERVLAGQTVLVRGERIVAMGPSDRVHVPTGAERIDGRGKYLMPGLADMHAHINGDAELLWSYLANGVTTVRDMFGRPELLALRDRVANGELLGPRIYAVGIDEECPKQQELASCLKAMKAVQVIMVKIYWDSRARFDSVVAIARELHLPVGGHVSQVVGLGPSLRVPYATLEHLWGYFEFLVGTRPALMTELALPRSSASPGPQFAPLRDTVKAVLDTASWMRPGWRLDPRKLRAVAIATRRAGTWNAPTLVAAEAMCWQPRNLIDAPERRLFRRIFEAKFPLVHALQDAGAGLLLSTDMSELGGFPVHRELELLVDVAGLTPYQALATGTRNVAHFLATEDSTGTVAVGKRADLVLLDGNPLRDIRYTAGPTGVMVGGRWLSRTVLETGLDSILVGNGSNADNMRRLRHAAPLHRGTPVYVWPDLTLPPTAFGDDDVCQRVRAAGR